VTDFAGQIIRDAAVVNDIRNPQPDHCHDNADYCQGNFMDEISEEKSHCLFSFHNNISVYAKITADGTF
jgi:hypothetical protein